MWAWLCKVGPFLWAIGASVIAFALWFLRPNSGTIDATARLSNEAGQVGTNIESAISDQRNVASGQLEAEGKLTSGIGHLDASTESLRRGQGSLDAGIIGSATVAGGIKNSLEQITAGGVGLSDTSKLIDEAKRIVQDLQDGR